MRLTRRYRFCSSHRLHSPALTDAENRDVYGKCNNPHGHGHNYVLDVTVAGPVDAETGKLADTKALDRLVNEQVVLAFDHRDLNREMPRAVPTTENLAAEIRARLRAGWKDAFPDGAPALAGVRIHETKRNIFELNEEL